MFAKTLNNGIWKIKNNCLYIYDAIDGLSEAIRNFLIDFVQNFQIPLVWDWARPLRDYLV